MTNRYAPHVLVLPEDDANRQIANGFVLNLENNRSIQVLPPSGGWRRVVEAFCADQVREMRNYPERRVILMIDFDRQFPDRFRCILERIPAELAARVFILGVLSEPEELNRELRHIGLEKIGEALAGDCSRNTYEVWGCPLLIHNQTELARLTRDVRPFLFL